MPNDPFEVSKKLDQLLDQIEVIHGQERSVSELSGGLTNANYRVRTRDGGDYVVRVSEASTGLLAIDRDNERHNTKAAANAGVGAPVIEAIPELGVLVVGYIDGRTLDSLDLQEPNTVSRVASAVRQLHQGPNFNGSFDMRRIRRYYLSVVQERGYRIPDDYLDLQPQIEAIEDAMVEGSERLVPCNNDLLAANFIDDGGKIWIIDYEYSGMNEASFEIGNIASEAFLEDAMVRLLVGEYWGDDLPSKVARAKAWSLLARYGWTLWASIQAGASAIDFDFWTWGMAKYDSARAELNSTDYTHILDGLASK